jgi:hypothetical protein
MIRSFDSLKFFVLYMGIALVVIGIDRGLCDRAGHRGPRATAAQRALEPGQGRVPPHQACAPTNDEIGEMSKALTSLVEGLRARRIFPMRWLPGISLPTISR